MATDHQNAIRTAQGCLEDARVAIHADILGGPRQITGCEAQLNHLLADRQKVFDALRALKSHVLIPTPRTPVEFAEVESR